MTKTTIHYPPMIITDIVTSRVLTVVLLYVGLEVPPTLLLLNRYDIIARMAPYYYEIGLELDIINSQLRIIQEDSRFPGPEEKCRKMLNVWLEGDTSATWEKLCKALERKNQNVLAGDIREKIRSM